MRRALSILIVAASAAAAPQGSGGSVEGKVISAPDGRGVRKATVTLRPARLQTDDGTMAVRDSYITETDGNGHFAVTGVLPGSYECVPSRTGYDSKPVSEFATTSYFPQITVTGGQQIQDVVLRLTPLGVISGRILDPEGFPISRASVVALQYGYTAGKQQLFGRQQAESDDRGEYRLYNLFPGTYYLRTEMEDRMQFSDPQIRGPKPEPFTMTYYPGLLDSAQARPVEVTSGGEARQVDIRMQKRPLYSIRGHLPPAGSQPAGSMTVMNQAGPQQGMVRAGPGIQITAVRRPADPTFQGSFGVSIGDGTFEVPGLPSGNYMLTAMRQDAAKPGSFQMARAFVDVLDHDVEGLDLLFAPALELAGVIKSGGTAKVLLETLRVMLVPVEQGPQAGAAVQADGAFVLRNVLPDLYRVRIMSPAVYVKSVKSGERELADGQLDLRRSGSDALTLVVSADMGRVEGTVTDDDGKPAPTINVTMIPDQDKADWHDRFQNQLTDAQGKYVFPALVPGHYTVFAWKDVQRGAPQDPEFRKPFEKLGISLTVEAGGRQTLDLKQIDAKKPPKQ